MRLTVVRCDGCKVDMGASATGPEVLTYQTGDEKAQQPVLSLTFPQDTDFCPNCKRVAISRALSKAASDNGVRLGDRPVTRRRAVVNALLGRF